MTEPTEQQRAAAGEVRRLVEFGRKGERENEEFASFNRGHLRMTNAFASLLRKVVVQ